MHKIKIKGIEVYHGESVVDNNFYYERFEKEGKDMKHYLEDIMGRDKRYLIDSDKENSLTMSLEAVKKLIKNNNIKGSDIDMIIFSSQLAEYVAPPTAVYIHHEIEGKPNCICYDMNVNCAGMIVAVEQISKYMQLSPNLNNVLLIGCDYINSTIDNDNELVYGNYGDAACALLLQRTDEEIGLIDSKFHINSIEYQNILFPKCGFSEFIREGNVKNALLKWAPFNGSDCAYVGIDNMKALMSENGLTKENISMFCFSQFAYKNIEIIREGLGIDESQSLYIGNEYGYTGTSSPFITLYEAINRGLVKRGDYIMFWTIGAGSENVAMLFKF